MQIANQNHQPIYHTFHTQITGLRSVNFNQVQSQIYPNHKDQTSGNRILEIIRPTAGHEGNWEKNEINDKEDTNKLVVVEGAKGVWVDRFSEDLENFPKNGKRYSLDFSEDLYCGSKVSCNIKKKESGSSFQEKLDFKKNMEKEEILKIFPQISLSSRKTCSFTNNSKNVEIEPVQEVINTNITKNFNHQNLIAGEDKFGKMFNNDVPENSREIKDFEECEIFQKNANKTSLSRFSENSSKNKFGSEKSMDSSCSTNATLNSVMFESTVMEPAAVPLFFLNKLGNVGKKETRINRECQTENCCDEICKEELYKAISELEVEILKERTLTKVKQNQIEELEKLVELNAIKYEANVKELEKEWVKKSEVLLSELREEHEKEIEGVIGEINQISSKQLSESVSRFQASIKTVQEEYKNFRISNESEKRELLGRIGEFEEIVKRMTDQIATFEGTSVISKINTHQIDKESQTSVEQRPSLDVGEFEEMEAKLSKQEKYISKQEKKLKEYKVEYERTFHRAEDYRRYIQENEMVIKNMEKDIKGLEKEVHEKNKNTDRLGCIVNSCCEELMKSEFMKLNEKYRRLDVADESC